MKLCFLAALLGSVLAILSSCTSISTLQTARALPKDKIQVLLGGGVYGLKQSLGTVGGTNSTGFISVPYIEGGVRFGLGGGLELGGRLTMPSSIGGDLKYQLVDGPEFAMALGLGLNYLGVEARTRDTNKALFTQRVIDIYVPVYFSYDFSKAFSLYTSPKFLTRLIDTSETKTINLLGGTLGIKLGEKAGLFLEGSYLKPLKDLGDQFQVATAFFFGFGGN